MLSITISSPEKLWLSEVQCSGNENRLDECPQQLYDENTHYKCPGRFRSAGAICSAAIPQKTSRIKSSGKDITVAQALTTKTDKRTGNLIPVTNIENMYSWNETGSTKTIKITTSRPEFNNTTAMEMQSIALMTMKAKDFKHKLSQTVVTVRNSHLPTPGMPTTTKSLNMTEMDNYIDNYQSTLLKDDNANQVTDNKVYIGNTSSHILHQEMTVASPLLCRMANRDSKGCEDYFGDDPNVQNFEIRLKGGRYTWEGHLQIRINEGTWGTICSDHWTLTEAMVACNQLKDYGKAKQTLQTSYFGGTDIPKIVYRIQCVGRELTFGSCNVTWSDKEHSCSKNTAVAGVVCSQPWRNNMRRLLRFSTVVHNRGLADFRPYRPRGQWEWHACHMHYHSMEIFAHYDILDAKGIRLAEGSKASFCLEDTTCDKGVHPQYNCRGFADQGLSVNCSDNYMYDIDCQWIDITELKPGEYTFLMEVNPTMLVAESNFDNNVVSCHLYYSGYFASLRNCHHESLLDYAHRGRKSE